jgi:hypothetical protein
MLLVRKIWLAEQRGSALGVITFTASPIQSGLTSTPTEGNTGTDTNNQSNYFSIKEKENSFVPHYGINYPEVVAPAIAGGIVVSAAFYIRSISDLRRSIDIIGKSLKGKSL